MKMTGFSETLNRHNRGPHASSQLIELFPVGLALVLFEKFFDRKRGDQFHRVLVFTDNLENATKLNESSKNRECYATM